MPLSWSFVPPSIWSLQREFWAGSPAPLWSRDEVVPRGGAQRRMGSCEGGGLGGVAQEKPWAGRPKEEEAFLSCLLGGAAETLQPSQKTQFGEQQLCIWGCLEGSRVCREEFIYELVRGCGFSHSQGWKPPTFNSWEFWEILVRASACAMKGLNQCHPLGSLGCSI